jgi:hypothetical protein
MLDEETVQNGDIIALSPDISNPSSFARRSGDIRFQRGVVDVNSLEKGNKMPGSLARYKDDLKWSTDVLIYFYRRR